MGIGKRIKEARLARNMTQEDLANKIGVTKGAIANYENETSHPKEAILYQLFSALHVDANFLFQDVASFSDSESFSDEEQKLIGRFRKLSSYEKETVIILIERSLAAPQHNADGAVAGITAHTPLPSSVSMLRASGTISAAAAIKEDRGFAAGRNRLEPGFASSLSSRVQKRSSEAPVLKLYPFLNYAASAGTDLYTDDIPAEQIEAPACRNADFIVGVSGSSMEPYYQNGDLLYVHQTDDVPVGSIGIFSYNGSLLVKKRGEDRLISSNTEFPDIYPNDGSQIITVGTVLGKVPVNR